MVTTTQKIPIIVRLGEKTLIANAAADRAEAAAAGIDATILQATTSVIALATAEADRATAAANSASATLAQASLYLTPQNIPAGSGLRGLLKLDLYPETQQGEPINWPDNLQVRQLSTDTSDRLRFRLGGGAAVDANGAYPQIAAENPVSDNPGVNGGTFSIGYAGLTGNDELPLYASDASLGVAKGRQVGTYRYDFSSAPLGVYYNEFYPPAQGLLQRYRVLPGETDIRRTKFFAREARAEDESSGFLQVQDEYLDSWLKEVRLFGVKDHKRIEVDAYETHQLGFRIAFRDKVNGNIVGYVTVPNPDYVNMDEELFIDPRTAAGNIGGETVLATAVYGVIRIDKSKIVPVGGNYGAGYKNAAAIGPNELKADSLMSRQEVEDVFRKAGLRPRAEQEIVVNTTNADRTQTADTELQDTLNSIYLEGPYVDPADASVRWCKDAMPDRPLGLALMPGHHVLSNAYIPHNVWLYPAIPGTLVTIGVRDSSIVRATVQAHNSHKIWGLTFLGDAVPMDPFVAGPSASQQYAFHRDKNNEFGYLDQFGEQNFWNGMDLVDCLFEGDEVNNFALTGMGIDSGSYDRIERVHYRSKNPNRTAPFAACHDTVGASEEAVLHFKNCSCEPIPGVAAVAVQGIHANSKQCRLIVENCPSFNLVNSSGTEANKWLGVGDYQGPISNTEAATYMEFSTAARLWNTSGAQIVAGTACVIDNRTVAVATDGDVVEAVALDTVANGAQGRFIITRRFLETRVSLSIAGGQASNELLYLGMGVLTNVPQPSGRPVARRKDGVITLAAV